MLSSISLEGRVTVSLRKSTTVVVVAQRETLMEKFLVNDELFTDVLFLLTLTKRILKSDEARIFLVDYDNPRGILVALS